jgi:O-antigen/teichoic acid export membrane protein
MTSLSQAVPAASIAAPRRRDASLVRNSALMMGTTVANLVLGYAFWLCAARLFSVSDVGLGAAVIAAMTLCGTIGGVGVGNALIQLLPSRRDEDAWSRTMTAGLLAGVGVSLLVAVVVIVVLPVLSSEFEPLRGHPLAEVGFLAGVALLVSGDLIDRAFVAERSSGSMLARNAVAAAGKIALVALPFVVVLGAAGIVVVWVAAAGLSLPAALLLQRRMGRRWRPVAGVRGEMKRIVRTIAGHHVVSIGNMVPQYVLPLLVAGMLSTAQNGVFYTTWRVAGGFMIVSVAVATSLFAEGVHDRADLGRNVRRALLVIGSILVPAALGAVVLGRDILELLGPAYAGGAALLALLALGAFPDAVTNVYVAVLRLERRFHAAAALTGTMAVLTIGLSCALVSPFGIAGVGCAFVASQTVGCLLVAADVLRRRSGCPQPVDGAKSGGTVK